MINPIEKAIFEIRQLKPLILNLTNFVTVDFVANGLLAIGAAPIMSACKDELEELVAICSAVYINIGTLDENFITLTKTAVEQAHKFNKPIVLDPVGAGATKIRTQVARSIAPHATIIRGNASEIMALGDTSYAAKGVESMHLPDDAKDIAGDLALKYHATVVVSGPIDFITDGTQSFHIPHGSSLMQLITGMGCTVTAVIAAFKTVVDDPFKASIFGAHYFALCGELASVNRGHPGQFKSSFIDELHAANFGEMEKLMSMKEHGTTLDKFYEI